MMDDTESSKLFLLRCKKEKYKGLYSGSINQFHKKDGEAIRAAVSVKVKRVLGNPANGKLHMHVMQLPK